jgi:hypothetical protein
VEHAGIVRRHPGAGKRNLAGVPRRADGSPALLL